MRIVEKMLYGIVGLLGIMLLLIVFCHFNPSIAESLGNSVQAKEETTEDTRTPEIAVFPVSTENGLSDELESQGYESPEEDALQIPSIVAEKNGYTPISEQGKQVSQARAEELRNTLSVGNTGDDLSYDELFYPYYYMLNDTGKALYRQIHANTDALVDSFKPVEDNINGKELKNAFTAVCNDHPELFWLNTGYSYKYAPNGTIAEIDLSLNYTAQSLEEAKAAFDKAVNEIIYGSRGVGDDYQKELYVHNALIKKISYDLGAPINQSAYSALVSNRTVCAGYARAFQYIMQQLGIPCYYCTGYAGQNHAWNIIKIDGDFYNVDVTWDDTTPFTYDYFNCSDADYAKDHVRKDLSVYLPPCNGSKYADLEENEADKAAREQAELEAQEKALREAEEAAKAEKEAKKAAAEAAKETEEASGVDEIKIQLVRGNGSDVTILRTVEEYYLDCAQAMMADDDNSISFTNIVENEKLWNSIKKAYEKGDYNAGYMERVLADKHKSTCNATVTAEKLEDGTYLVRHVMTIK